MGREGGYAVCFFPRIVRRAPVDGSVLVFVVPCFASRDPLIINLRIVAVVVSPMTVVAVRDGTRKHRQRNHRGRDERQCHEEQGRRERRPSSGG